MVQHILYFNLVKEEQKSCQRKQCYQSSSTLRTLAMLLWLGGYICNYVCINTVFLCLVVNFQPHFYSDCNCLVQRSAMHTDVSLINTLNCLPPLFAQPVGVVMGSFQFSSVTGGHPLPGYVTIQESNMYTDFYYYESKIKIVKKNYITLTNIFNFNNFNITLVASWQLAFALWTATTVKTFLIYYSFDFLCLIL